MVNASVCLATIEYHQQAVDLFSPFNHEWCTYYLNSGFFNWIHFCLLLSLKPELIDNSLYSYNVWQSGVALTFKLITPTKNVNINIMACTFNVLFYYVPIIQTNLLGYLLSVNRYFLLFFLGK